MIYSAIGMIACGLVVCAFYAKSAIPMRTYAIASNVAFLTYAIPLRLWPIVALHGLLLPLNIVRLKGVPMPGELSDGAKFRPGATTDQAQGEDRWSDVLEADTLQATIGSRFGRPIASGSVNIGYVIFAFGVLWAVVSGLEIFGSETTKDACMSTPKASSATPIH